jgi:ATP-dependent helicase HrpB
MASATCAELQPLPIDSLLPQLVEAMAAPGATVLLQAPPGAGKTTRVARAVQQRLVQERLTGVVWMLEPRRIAARSAAQRMATEAGEVLGGHVGYSVRLESRTSAATRIEVLTEGLFLRRLQSDPALEGVDCVIFDEFHERHADADLALALVRQARALLRPELRLIVMSATLELEPLAQQLPEATLLRSEGRSFPVAISHQPPRPDERLPAQVVRALEQHWLDQVHPGDTVLVFLPGLGGDPGLWARHPGLQLEQCPGAGGAARQSLPGRAGPGHRAGPLWPGEGCAGNQPRREFPHHLRCQPGDRQRPAPLQPF